MISSEMFLVRIYLYAYSTGRQDALLPLLFNFALEHAIRNVQETYLGQDINGTHQILAFAHDVNLIKR